MSSTTLEYFGTTTFRILTRGLTIFHDTWLERTAGLPVHLPLASVTSCDYILINHAHFDHLPGAEVVAKTTGAKVIANAEAIRILRTQGVPEEQLIPVAGGEFISLGNGVTLRVYPGLHCFHPDGDAETLSTLHHYEGKDTQSPRDVTEKMTNAISALRFVPDEELPTDGLRNFKRYFNENWGKFSMWDGGCLLFYLMVEGEGNLLFNAHCGAYMGIYEHLEPKPDAVVLAVAGQPCVEGKGWTGTAAQFILDSLKALQFPKKFVMCLHDETEIPPLRVDTSGIKELVKDTPTKIVEITPGVDRGVHILSP